MKVIHIRASNFFGGPEKQIVSHLLLVGGVRSGVRSGARIQSLLCSFHEAGKKTELVAQARKLGIASISVPCTNPYDPRQILHLRKLFIRERPHLLCTHDYRSSSLSLIGRTGLRTRQIAFWRGTTRENLKVALYHRIERYLLRQMDHVVVVSREQHDFLTCGGLPESKVSFVPNAVDVGSFEKQEGEREKERQAIVLGKFSGKTIVATAGRLSSEKGHRCLIEAMPRVLARRRDVTLLVFGEGPMRGELSSLAEKLGCSGSVHFLGFVPDFPSLLKGIDLFVLPSLSEGLPNVLLEALAAAKPVVATAVGGVPELIVDGATGLLISPCDSSELADAILKLLYDPVLARRLGQAGQEVVRKSYSFERQCRFLMEVYSKVLGDEGTRNSPETIWSQGP